MNSKRIETRTKKEAAAEMIPTYQRQKKNKIKKIKKKRTKKKKKVITEEDTGYWTPEEVKIQEN